MKLNKNAIKPEFNLNFKTMEIINRTWHTAKSNVYQGRRIKGISQTIPDQTMTLRQIIDRFSRGLPVTGNIMQEVWEDTELPNLKTLDISERMELARTFSEELLEIQDKLARETDRKKKDELKAQLKAELAAEMNEAASSAKNKITDNQSLKNDDKNQ